MTRHGLLACVLLAAAGAAFAAAPAPAGVKVEHAWIRWLSVSLPSTGYAVIVNGSDATVRLTGARSADYGTAMLHRSLLANSDSRMVMVDALDIPAHGSVKLAPGDYHLMLTHPTRALKPGDTVPVTLHFAGGGELQVNFSVLPANSTGPAD
jgi:copper(I)-binding protein